MKIYIGASKDTRKRIYMHFYHSIESSLLRKRIAQSRDYQIIYTPRPAPAITMEVTLAIPALEDNITEYLEAGKWKFVECRNRPEAVAFKDFAISRLDPMLIQTNNEYPLGIILRFEELLLQLNNCQEYTLSLYNLQMIPKSPGVHLFISEQDPSAGLNKKNDR